MIKTLNSNYQKNIKIMAINLNKGMSYDMAIKIIDGQVAQFKNANLYDAQAQDYINELKSVVISHFSKIQVNVINLNEKDNN